MSDGLACVPRHLQTWMAQLSLASPGSSWQSMFSSSFWAVDVAAPRHLPGALFPRAGPREEASLHTEHCALSPGPSLSGHRTTAGNQNADPCVKMIQNSRWQEQAVQAERGVPVIKQPPVSQEEDPKEHRHLGKQPCAGGRRCSWTQCGPPTLQGLMEGQPLLGESAGPWEESQSLVRMPVTTRLRSSAGSTGRDCPGVSLPQGLPVLFTDS